MRVMDYWSQPYPRDPEHARRIRSVLRGEGDPDLIDAEYPEEAASEGRGAERDPLGPEAIAGAASASRGAIVFGQLPFDAAAQMFWEGDCEIADRAERAELVADYERRFPLSEGLQRAARSGSVAGVTPNGGRRRRAELRGGAGSAAVLGLADGRAGSGASGLNRERARDPDARFADRLSTGFVNSGCQVARTEGRSVPRERPRTRVYVKRSATKSQHTQ